MDIISPMDIIARLRPTAQPAQRTNVGALVNHTYAEVLVLLLAQLPREREWGSVWEKLQCDRRLYSMMGAPTCLILMAAHKPLGPAPTIKTS